VARTGFPGALSTLLRHSLLVGLRYVRRRPPSSIGPTVARLDSRCLCPTSSSRLPRSLRLLKVNQQTVRNWVDRGELAAVRVGARRVRVRQSDLDTFLEAGATIIPESGKPEMLVDEGSVTAWATFGAALAEASARLDDQDREQLVATLDALAEATRELVNVLGGR
jgi:excisionase family DNA binding protein